MSRTNIDYLFQVTTPSLDRSMISGARHDEQRPPFGDLLSRASTTPTTSTTPPRPEDRGNSLSQNGKPTAIPAQESPIANTNTSGEGADQSTDLSSESAGSTTSENEAVESSVTEHESNSEEKTEDNDAASEALDAIAAAVEPTVAKASAVGKTSEKTKLTESAAANSKALSEEQKSAAQQNTAGTKKARSGESRGAGIAQPAEGFSENDGEALAQTAQPEQLNTPVGASETKAAQTSKEKANSSGNRDGDRKATQATDGAEVASGDKPQNPHGEAIATKLDDQSNNKTKAESADRKKTSNLGTRVDNNTAPAPQAAEAIPATEQATASQVANVLVNTAQATAAAVEQANDAAATKTGTAKQESVTSFNNRLHPNNVTNKRAAEGMEAEDAPRIDPARFVGRIAKAFQAAQERGGVLQIRLSPPELGAMRMELTVKDGVMTASLETDNLAAKQVLLDNLPALRERLAEQNIRIDRFDVEVRREATDGQPDGRTMQDQQQTQQGQAGRRPTMTRTLETVSASPAIPMVPTPVTSSVINLVA